MSDEQSLEESLEESTETPPSAPKDRTRAGVRVFRWIGTAMRWGRVALFTAVVAAGLSFGYVGKVRGAAGERALKLGRELTQLGDLLGGAHRVSLNGENMYVASAVSP